MTIPQADGTTEATLRGPSLQSTPQTAARRGPASAANRRRQRRNLNTRKRPKSGNITRRRVPRANIKTSQMEKGLCLQRKGSENPVRQLVLLQVHITLQTEGDGDPRGHTEIPDPTLSHTHPVDPDLEEGPCLIQDLEAGLDLEGDLSLDLGLGPILTPGLNQGTDPDPDL